MAEGLWDFDDWAAPDCRTWDQETGAPTITHFGNAIQVWSLAQSRPTSVAEAAMIFNVRPHRIIEAVEDHSWMLLVGDPKGDLTKLIIDHDGD